MNMKNLLFFVVMLLVSLSASAKVVSGTRDSSGVKFGIRESFTLSNMNQRPESLALFFGNAHQALVSSRLQPGFAAGFALDIPVLESLHLNLELKYVMKGQRFIANVADGSLDNDFTLIERIGYLELPVQPQFRLNLNQNTHLNFNVGPYLAYALHASQYYVSHFEINGKRYDSINRRYVLSGGKVDGSGYVDDPEYECKADYSRSDIGFAFGLDLVVKKCHIGASYELGLKNYNAKSYLETPGYIANPFSKPIKNRSLCLTFGWDF